MTKDQILKIGLDLQQIALAVDDATLKRINKPLKEIEEIVKEDYEKSLNAEKASI